MRSPCRCLPYPALPAAAEALEQVQRMTEAQLSHAWSIEANSAVSRPPALPCLLSARCLPSEVLLIWRLP